MHWIALLHVACLLPTLGLIFGTSCCCAFVCVSCGDGKFAVCSNTNATVSFTISGIANSAGVLAVCENCGGANGTYLFSSLSGGGCFQFRNVAVAVCDGGNIQFQCGIGSVCTDSQGRIDIEGTMAAGSTTANAGFVFNFEVQGDTYTDASSECTRLQTEGPWIANHAISSQGSNDTCDLTALSVSVNISGV